MDGLVQATVYDTSSPANIYSTTVMHSVDGNEKILIISAKKDVITLESKTVNNEIQTSIVELNFSNIPSNAEIIAIHCINRSKEFDDFVVGITYLSIIDDQNVKSFFNIYSGFPGSSLEAIMENCETLELNYIPFQLSHAVYMCKTHKKGMWLLSGSDKKIHAYESDEQKIYEQKIEDYFIEYEDTKDSIVLRFGTKSFRNFKKRISFYGCETGYSILTIVDSELNQILHCFPEHYQSPVTVMQLFNIYNRTANDDFIPNCDIINEKEQVCLLVGSAIENAVVYMNVLKNNLEKGIILSNGSRQQAVVCSLIADVNFDSKNEILLGTHENYILHYIYENDEWIEQPQFDIRHSVYNICYLDITGEGVNDLVVMSERGIHILKHRTRDILEILKTRLKLSEEKESKLKLNNL